MNNNGPPYKWGLVEFSIDSTIPEEDECYRLISKILGQAVLDYVNFKKNLTQVSEEDFLSAEEMLFDPEYRILWGDFEITTRELCSIINIELDWFLNRIERKIRESSK